MTIWPFTAVASGPVVLQISTLLAYIMESRRRRNGIRFARSALRDARHVMFDDDTRFVSKTNVIAAASTTTSSNGPI